MVVDTPFRSAERFTQQEHRIVDPDRPAVPLCRLDDGRYAPGRRIRSGSIPSRVLPRLELTVEELRAD